MSKLIAIVFMLLLSSAIFAQQAGKCPFPAPAGKVKNDQYSHSSEEEIKKSKKEMAQQQDVFDKKKYQSVIKKGSSKKRSQKPRL